MSAIRKSKFLKTMFFIFLLLLPFSLFCEDDGDDSDDGYSWTETPYSGEDGWDGTENTPNSPNDEPYEGDYSSTSWYSEGDDNYCLTTDEDGSYEVITYEDVYDEDGNPIFHCDDPDVESRVYDFFEDEHTARLNDEAAVKAARVAEALTALSKAYNSLDRDAVHQARAELKAATAELNEFCEKNGYSWDNCGNSVSVNDKNSHTVIFIGDPIVLATGKFVINDCDAVIGYGRGMFSFTRNYVSEIEKSNNSSITSERQYGALGKGWSSSIDTRIILNCFSADESLMKKIEDYLQVLCETEKIINEYVAEDEECQFVLDELLEEKSEYEKLLEDFRTSQALAEQIKENNKFVNYGAATRFSGTFSSDCMFYYHENGGLAVLEKDENGDFLPLGGFWKGKLKGSEIDEGYLLIFNNTGEKRYYSSFGLPVKFESSGGDTVLFEYDQDFVLKSITANSGEKMNFQWENGLLNSLTTAAGCVKYQYENERLVSIIDFDSDEKLFEYDSNGLMKKQIKADGSYVEFEYEKSPDDFAVCATVNEEGKRELFSYNWNERKTTYTDYDGVSADYFYDEKFRTVKSVEADGTVCLWTYDDSGNNVFWTNGKNSYSYTYDELGRIISKEDENGICETFSYSDSELCGRTFGSGRAVSFSYDSGKNLTDVFVNGEMLCSFTYDSKNLATKVVDCHGNKRENFFDNYGRLISTVVYNHGKTVPAAKEKWEYDSTGRIVFHERSDGITEKFSYFDHSVKKTTSSNVEYEYVFSSRKLLLSCSQKDLVTGEIIRKRYEYDRNRRCINEFISGIDSAGKVTGETLYKSWRYSDAGRLLQENIFDVYSNNASISAFNDASRVKTVSNYDYDAYGNLSGIEKLFSDGRTGLKTLKKTEISSYFSEGMLTVTERGGNASTTFSYDSDSRLSEVLQNGKSVYKADFTATGQPEKFFYGPWKNFECEGGQNSNLIKTVIEKNGERRVSDELSYYPDGKIKTLRDGDRTEIAFEYDAAGNLSKVLKSDCTFVFDYDESGMPVRKQILDDRKNIVFEEEFLSDPQNRIVFHKTGGKLVEKWLKNGFGLLIKSEDSDGNCYTYFYDLLCRLSSVLDPYGNRTSFKYDVEDRLTQITFPDKSFRQFQYSENPETVTVTDKSGIVSVTRYDSFGRISSVAKRPHLIPEEYQYDDYGRITVVRRGDSTVLEYSYNDVEKKVIKTDAKGHATCMEYDPFGRMLRMKNRNQKETFFEYDDYGELKAQIDFNGKSRIFSPEMKPGKSVIKNASGGETFYEWDAAGNLIFAGNNDSSASYSYDAFQRLISQTDENSGETIFYDYDTLGHITSIKCEDREITCSYEKRGLLSEILDRTFSNGETVSVKISFMYDSVGREINRKWSSGEYLNSFYDESGRLILKAGYVPEQGLVFADGVIYDKSGAVAVKVDSSFGCTLYRYDSLGRVSSVSYPFSKTREDYLKELLRKAGLYSISQENSGVVHLSSEEYEKYMEICMLAGHGSGGSPAFPAITERFEYDENSNLIKRTTPYGTICYNYDAEDRLLSWGNGCTASYDLNGNMIRMEDCFKTLECEYDMENRMKTLSYSDKDKKLSGKISYAYDALGRKILKTENKGETEVTSYMGTSYRMLYQKSEFKTAAVNNSSSRYKFFDAENYTRHRSDFAKNADTLNESKLNYGFKKYFGYDYGGMHSYCIENGTSHDSDNVVSLMTDAQGTVKNAVTMDKLVWELNYDILGTPLSDSSWGGFIGKSFDTRTGTYDFGQREYMPEAGRFLSQDPLMDGNNWYTYCSGDFVNYLDPDGLSMIEVPEQFMQSMGYVLLGNASYSFTRTIDKSGALYIVDGTDYGTKAGCLVTAISSILSVYNNMTITPSGINGNLSNFIENTGLINWNAVCENYGLSRTSTLMSTIMASNLATSLPKIEGPYASQVMAKASAKAQSSVINSFLSQTTQGSAGKAVIVEARYDPDNLKHTHFVVAAGQTLVIGNTVYLPITATSKFDYNINEESERGKMGWIIVDGKILVPVSAIVRFDTIGKNN